MAVGRQQKQRCDMEHSVKKFASEIKKKRFTIKYPDGRIESFGTCNVNEDERFGIEFWNGIYFLTQYQLSDIDYSQPPKQRELLPEGSLVANGYYEHEWDEFVSPMDWLRQQ